MMQSTSIAKAVKLLVATVAVGVMGSAAAAEGTTRVIVKFKDGHGNASMKSAVSAMKGTVKHEIFGMNAMAIEVPQQALKGLKNNPNVEYVEEDHKRYPSALTSPSTGNPYLLGQAVPYGIKLVQADLLPDTNAGNRRVCIIDSGIDRAHPDLNGNSANMTGVYDSGTGNWYTDQNSHGTHVAGTIAAVNNSNVGVVGVNSNRRLKLHIVKVFGANGWAYSSTLASAANQCASYGANVISMSLGGPSYNSTENSTFANLASRGILNIAAAGNAGNTAISYPAGYTSVMSVGAVNEYKQWASFSQYNSKVEIAGPGVGVRSTVPGGGYANFDGTSMATPHVAGVAALVWSYFPTCTGAQIRTSLGKSAQDLGTAGRDTRYGFGLVQARAAYDRIRNYGCGV
ncbi:S8 family peptidase [Massilia sp. PAMC28688]|uniref:S8 family peptidase n=1 Tax=Massilia sp. PAMC28688 TaxID=2861283 RepID=UPI001C625FD5|nr:S8 family peptidase [Massilia sp. PAMC28688]QYF92473.1 S8 family peptidase [Massilia sp. PAMC28688]